MSTQEFYKHRAVVVTGGAGFAGSHVVERLVALGARVRVPVRRSTPLEPLSAVIDRVEIVEADLSDAADARRAVDAQEIVLHLAAARGGGIAHSQHHHGSLFRANMLSGIHAAFLN